MTIIENLPVRVTYIGAPFRGDWGSKGSIVDQWRIEITSKNEYWSTDYFTGIGLRKKGQPVKPSIHSIMESLLLDASAADYNFSDWCDEFGYSDDSNKAMNIYKQCLEIGTALRKHIGRDTLAQVKKIIDQ